jgi:hypothetical protein
MIDESQDIIKAHKKALQCLDKTNHLVDLHKTNSGVIDIESLCNFICDESACKVMKIDWVLINALVLRAVIEIKKLRTNKFNDSDLVSDLNNKEQKLMDLHDPYRKNGQTFLESMTYPIEVDMPIFGFYGAILDFCEPCTWPKSLISKHASKDNFWCINKYKIENSLFFDKHVLSWYYGWNWFLPKGKKITENNGVVWLDKAARTGNIAAQKTYAEHFKSYRYRNAEKEAFWYLQAALQGDGEAEETFGFFCFDGHGVEENIPEGIKWLRRAADKGYTTSLIRLAQELISGENISQDYAEAVAMLKIASPRNARATQLLAYCYGQGLGLEKNREKSCELYLDAAKRDNEYAKWNLSMCYFDGDGVEKDWIKAYAWRLKIHENHFSLDELKKWFAYTQELNDSLSEAQKAAAKEMPDDLLKQK